MKGLKPIMLSELVKILSDKLEEKDVPVYLPSEPTIYHDSEKYRDCIVCVGATTILASDGELEEPQYIILMSPSEADAFGCEVGEL